MVRGGPGHRSSGQKAMGVWSRGMTRHHRKMKIHTVTQRKTPTSAGEQTGYRGHRLPHWVTWGTDTPWGKFHFLSEFSPTST